MKLTAEDIRSFCQDIDALTTSFRYARQFKFSVPPVGSWVLVAARGNPAMVRITAVDGTQCTGVVEASLSRYGINVGTVLNGCYLPTSTEWHYEEDQEMQFAEDYRQCTINMVKSQSRWYRDNTRLRWKIKANNTATNLFLQDIVGESLLTQTVTLKDALTWSKRRGEYLLLGGVVLNVLLILLMVAVGSSGIFMLANAACTLYSLYNWYDDLRIQKRMQNTFNCRWGEKKKEYQQLNDMIQRYGLSPNRISALYKWNMHTRNVINNNLADPLEVLGNIWYARIDETIRRLDMEDAPNEQQAVLDTLWTLTDTYINDFSRFYTEDKNE